MDALDYCNIASEAYDAKPDFGLDNSASRAILRKLGDHVVVAFRGTDDTSSFLNDIDIIPMDIPNIGKLHSGFWHAWQHISEPIKRAIGSSNVVFTGHSLGAAIALIAALDCKISGISVRAVYAFEPPMISPIDLSSKFNGIDLNLYKNGDDVIPELPIGWKHPGNLIEIGHDKKFNLFFIEDHLIANVIKSLKENK